MNTSRRAVLFAIAVVASVVASLGLVGDALAQLGRENETFGIAPYPAEVDGTSRGSFEIPLERGSTWEDAIRIYNRTSETVRLVIYATDAEETEEAVVDPTGFRTSEPKGVGAWIDLSRSSIELKPRDEAIVTFRVDVADSDPSPNLGAIVVENATTGQARETAQREHLLVRTIPPNTETTSARVRPLLLRSPWIIVAMLGLVLAIALVWVGARRAKRPQDVVVAPGEIEGDDTADVLDASRPVIKRLGKTASVTAVLERATTSSRSDDRPLLDDALLVEVDPDEDLVDEDDEDDELEFTDEEDDAELEASDDDPDDEEADDLPPARSRPASRRVASNGRRTASKKKPAPKRKAAPKRTPARKPAVRKPTAKQPAAKKKVPARAANAKRNGDAAKRSTKPAASERGYIPLTDL